MQRGSRFYILTWNMKPKALSHKMCLSHRKHNSSLGTLHNTLNIWSWKIISNRSVLLSVSGFNSGINLNVSLPSLLVPGQKSNRGVFYYIVELISLIVDILHTIMRGIQLMCTFTPLLLLYPLTKISSKLKSAWYKMLLIGISLSGPIIIKLGQWASTRRDLFSEELCRTLSKLQRTTIPHSWYYTKKCLENAYGSNWQDIFVEFDNKGQPIGSGCCAQVYKVWIKRDLSSTTTSKTNRNKVSENFFVEVLEVLGLGYFSSYSKKTESHLGKEDLIPVAVKVRHPQMETKFRQDLNILKFFACTITWLIPSSKWLSLTESVDEFSRVMKSQVNLLTEAENLKVFADNFKNSSNVKFPHPLESLTRPNILVESFEDGRNIDDFLTVGVSNKTRRDLALIGVNTVLKMIFKDNFIHGDMHPGNILVQKKDATKNSWQILFPFTKLFEGPSTLVILDCGIVSSLDQRGKKCLRDVFAAVASNDGERVGELFLEHSKHQCTNISGFKMEMKEIVENAMSKRVTLGQVDVSELMNSLFSTMTHHKVKVDSSFSSVILSIMVIEGLGRSLDPTIDIIERAKPYLFSYLI